MTSVSVSSRSTAPPLKDISFNIVIEICYTNQNCINNGEAVPIIDAILVYMLLF